MLIAYSFYNCFVSDIKIVVTVLFFMFLCFHLNKNIFYKNEMKEISINLCFHLSKLIGKK